MIHDGLWDVYENFHMGVAAELVAEKYKISRQEQDQFALESHQRAVRAMNSCYIESQILPIEVPQKKGEPIVIRRDESPRPDSSLEALAKLKPPFKKDGTVTAGNAPGTNDGAAAVVVTSQRTADLLGKTPMALIVAQSVSGIEPKWLLMAPVEAIEKILKKTGWDRDRDVDLYELNEAFAVQALAVMRELRARSRESERQRRRRRHRPSHRRVRRAHPGHAALRNAAPQRPSRHRRAVPGRRQRRSPGRRTLAR